MAKISALDVEELEDVRFASSLKISELGEAYEDSVSHLEHIADWGFKSDDTSNTQASIRMLASQIGSIFSIHEGLVDMYSGLYRTIKDDVIDKEDDLSETIAGL